MNKIGMYLSASVVVLLSFLSNTTKAQTATVNLTSTKQYIDGFGACTAWHGQISDIEADAAFNNATANQLGLSILRVRIDPSSSAWNDEKQNAQKAKARGATILATPWTPPASMKTNNNTVGGELLPASYAAYAAHLKAFCDNLGTVDAVSIQNEPNITVTYESCTWNATQLLNFCKSNAPSIGKPVLMPEAYNFDHALSDTTLNNPTARANITFIGGHLYGAAPLIYANAATNGKKVWMTEHYYNPEDIGTCVTMGKEILDCFNDNMSAYIWWYLRLPGCNIINADGSIQKKGYIMGQFSKFVRPGYTRIDATYQPQSGVYVVGFKGAEIVIVAVNQNTASKSQTFAFQNGTVAKVNKYTTSSTKNITNDGGVTMTGNSFTTTLDAQSVTTFVGTPSTSIAFSQFRSASPSTIIPYGPFLEREIPLALYGLNGRRYEGKVIFMDRQHGSTLWQEPFPLPPGVYILQMNAGNLKGTTMKWSKLAQ